MKYSALLFWPAAGAACAAEESASRSPGFSASTSLVSWILSTLAVLALIFVLAWLLKKTRLVRGMAGGRIQVVSQLGLGPKERVVEIEVEGRNILLGVTPSSINYLCEVRPEPGFASELKAEEGRGAAALQPSSGRPGPERVPAGASRPGPAAAGEDGA